MATKIFRSNSFFYQVEQREDGTLNLSREYQYRGGEWQPTASKDVPNVGAFINQQGGIDGLLAKCEDIEDISAEVERVNGILRKRRDEVMAAKAARQEERARKIAADYDKIFAGEVTETNADSVYVLLRKLNSENWGGWELPKMTIGYTCNQYDCDGKTATTIKLDSPIIVSDEEGTMFQYGAPVGHLRKYRRIAPENFEWM